MYNATWVNLQFNSFYSSENITSTVPNKITLLVFKHFFTVNIRLNINIKLKNTNYCGMIEAEEDN